MLVQFHQSEPHPKIIAFGERNCAEAVQLNCGCLGLL
jgi:hypothetical protein